MEKLLIFQSKTIFDSRALSLYCVTVKQSDI